MKYLATATAVSLLVVGIAQADDAPKWANSYSVGDDGDQCYCVMNEEAAKNRGEDKNSSKRNHDGSVGRDNSTGRDNKVGRDKRNGSATLDVAGRDTDIAIVCNLISSILGDGGAGEKRYYKSLQCGNLPVIKSSDASCMGVAAGKNKNCDAKGPLFNLGRLFTNNNN